MMVDSLCDCDSPAGRVNCCNRFSRISQSSLRGFLSRMARTNLKRHDDLMGLRSDVLD